jgi:plastocyanin
LADPEQIYQEVLQEEQQKGSSGPVADGRAKAARVRAEHGSPHPKEPRWWPGAQPHFEGGDGAAPVTEVAEPEAAEEPAAEAPAEPAAEPAEPPAATTPAAEPAPAPAPATTAPAEAPAAASAAPAPPAAAQAPAAAAAAAQAPAAEAPAATAVAARPAQPARPAGVTHGTASGNRLRPEDAVGTESQFEGQKAMLERRRLIDELVATGVPAVSAAATGRPRAPYLAVLYLIIPLVVIAFLVAQPDAAPEPTGGAGETPADGGGAPPSNADVTLVAANLAFDTDSIELPADSDVVVALDNQDTAPHNFSLYETEQDADAQSGALFEGSDVAGGASTEYEFTSPAAGDYVFQCDIHPTMRGDATVG